MALELKTEPGYQIDVNLICGLEVSVASPENLNASFSPSAFVCTKTPSANS